MIKKIKDLYQFLRSLPELSRPGISSTEVYEFLRKYSPTTPVLAARLAASQFMENLPDANQFSKLELMLLANTVKAQYSPSDAELYKGISRIVENYDRAIVSFEDLLNSVAELNVKPDCSKIGRAAEVINKSLLQLNSESKKPSLFAFRKEYRAQIAKAERSFDKNEVDSAVTHFKEALVFNKRRSEAYFGLAESYQRKGLFADAMDILSELIETAPCKPVLSKAHLMRASCFLAVENPRAALEDLSHVDDSDSYKYRFKQLCHSTIDSISGLGAVADAKDTLKQGYHCYALPAFRYWRSTKKKPVPAQQTACPVDKTISDAEYRNSTLNQVYARFKEQPQTMTASQKEAFIDLVYSRMLDYADRYNTLTDTTDRIIALTKQRGRQFEEMEDLANRFNALTDYSLKQTATMQGINSKLVAKIDELRSQNAELRALNRNLTGKEPIAAN